jgi:hypothetical protein
MGHPQTTPFRPFSLFPLSAAAFTTTHQDTQPFVGKLATMGYEVFALPSNASKVRESKEKTSFKSFGLGAILWLKGIGRARA